MNTPTSIPGSAPARSRIASFVRQYLPILISGGLGAALSATLFFAIGGWEQTRLKAIFDQQAEIRATAIRQRIITSLEVLGGFGAFYAVNPQVDQQAFRIFASRILAQHPEIQAIEWAPRTVDSSVQAHLRPEHFLISYAEPVAGNESVIGFDVSSDATRWAAMERARDTGELVMTSRLRLLQEPSGQFGVQAFVPIYRGDTARHTLSARRNSLQGFVVTVFRVRDLVELSLVGLKPALMDVWLADESAAPDERVLYQQQSRPGPQRKPSDREPPTRTPFTWTTTFDVAGRLWSFHASPTRRFFAMHRTWLPWGVLSAGLLLTVLLINILFNALRRSAQVERQVARRTEELTAEVAERQRVEAALTISELRYRRLFETAKDGILILDGDTGLIIDVNPFLVEMLGYAPKEILGKHLWEIGPFKDIARSKMAFGHLQTKEYVRYEDLPLQTKIGQSIDVEFVSNVYRVDSKRVIQCNIRDITARKRAEEALQLAHAELEQKVQDRTGELSNANEHLQASYEQVRRLALRLQSIREDERSGIARELHDELGQALTALKMDLVWASGKLPAEQGLLPERITAMVTLVDRMVETVQQVSSTLRPGILDDFGLLEAMRWQGREFQERTSIVCRTQIELEQLELDPDHVTSLFRILQEALTNVARHAHATEVTVKLTASNGQLVLEIVDNGKGIATARINDATSLGLIGMRERALLLKGRVIMTGAAGRGTMVRVEMPYPEPTTETAA
ncbi:MAG: hypothetical protein COV75_02800 [Candidatus Omnitrophica bacterium CG11_big_fil_rev_8_21_14_0_20_63_9]|nr:MAG: hypothetical protein COV75_02800 [Candidatus Omnitrophica bacterium CG11_big_fil_rev_8_21_14_0_20_63_9]